MPEIGVLELSLSWFGNGKFKVNQMSDERVDEPRILLPAL